MLLQIEAEKLVTKLNRNDGEHLIYFNEEVFRVLTGLEPKHWRKDLIQGNDWVVTDDGSVIECLRVNYYNDVEGKRDVYYCKFPVSGNHYYRISRTTGEIYYSRLYGRVTRQVKDYRYRVDEVYLFTQLLLSGMSIKDAFRTATKKSYNSYRVLTMMNSKQFKDLIMEDSNIIGKLRQRFTDDVLLKEIELLIDRSRKGSDSHRENIKFLMLLTGKLPEQFYDKKIKTLPRIQEADYRELPPPQIEANNSNT
jgi:hypothetical protein